MRRTPRVLGQLRLTSHHAAASASLRQPFQRPTPAISSSISRTFHTSLHRDDSKVPAESQRTLKEPEVGFAFDIDGVLYRGGDPIEGAAEALRALQREHYRYVFLTNGGGVHEEAKAASLHEKLKFREGETVVGDRVIQSHTPKKGWPEHIKKNDTVLVTGHKPHWVRQIANTYGFANVVTPADIEAACPKIYPFLSLQPSWEIHQAWNKSEPLPAGKEVFVPENPYTTDIPKSALKIDHIFVWNDPRDWSLDIQLINDVLMSHKGYLGTYSSKNGDKSLPNNGWQQDDQPCLWISNLDLHWKTQYPINRFGTGAFVEALKGVWRAATDGKELQYSALGKPLQVTYEYAHDRLLQMQPTGTQERLPKSLKRVYMIGDNPESDISGANKFNPEDGTEWKSILVRTGVWHPTAMEPEPRHKPDAIVNDVADAIVWALNNEGIEMTREQLLEIGKAKSEEAKLKEKVQQAVTMPSAPVGRIVA